MRDILFRLQKDELEQLRDAIESGQMRHPYKSISIAQILGNTEVVQLLVDSLNGVAQKFGPEKVGVFVDMVYQDSCKRVPEKNYELVWTGPEGDGAYNRDTSVVVQQLFDQAKKSVLIVGFAFFRAKEMFEVLAKKLKDNQNFKVTLCLNVHREYRDTTASENLISDYKTKFLRESWPFEKKPNIYFDPRSLEIDSKKKAQLHAKCIVVDESVSFIGSANFTDKAQLSNIEAGLLVRDPEFAQDLSNHFYGLIDANHLLPLL